MFKYVRHFIKHHAAGGADLFNFDKEDTASSTNYPALLFLSIRVRMGQNNEAPD